MDVGLDPASLRAAEPKRPPPPTRPPSGVKAVAFEMFDKGDVPEDVAHQTNRSVRAVLDDLADYIRWKAPKDVSQWIKKETLRSGGPGCPQSRHSQAQTDLRGVRRQDPLRGDPPGRLAPGMPERGTKSLERRAEPRKGPECVCSCTPAPYGAGSPKNIATSSL